jgi:hypothetical protein
VPRKIIQTAINVYNDLEFCDDVRLWVPGILYFAVSVVLVEERDKEKAK